MNRAPSVREPGRAGFALVISQFDAQRCSVNQMKNLVVIVIFGLICFAFYKAFGSLDTKAEIKTVDKLPASVQNLVKKMDASDKNAFLLEFNQRKKSTFFSYILWPLGALYYAYNKKIGLQFVFWITFGGGLIWWIVDLFRMPFIVEQANSQIAREIAQTLSLGKSFEK